MRCKHCYEPMKMYWIGIKKGNLTVTYICQNHDCKYTIKKQEEMEKIKNTRDRPLNKNKKQQLIINGLKGGKM